MTYGEVITKRILDLCHERKITVNKLATLSGMKQSTVDNIIRQYKKPWPADITPHGTGLWYYFI